MRTPRRIFTNGKPFGQHKPEEQKKKEVESVAAADGAAAAAPESSNGAEGVDAAADAPNADAESITAHTAKDAIPQLETTLPRKSPVATIVRKIRAPRKR